MSETSVERRYAFLENRAKEILREAGIPLNPLYHVREKAFPSDRPLPSNLRDQGWHQARDCIWRDELPEGWWDLGMPRSGKATPLQEILLRPYHPDSDPAMAAAFLNRIHEYREAVRKGESEAAALAAASIGELHGRWSWIWEARKGIASMLGGSSGGSRSGRRQWAEQAARQISRWDDLPESYEPLEVDEDLAVYQEFRGGSERIVAQDPVTEKEISSLARSTFEKRYLRKSAGQ